MMNLRAMEWMMRRLCGTAMAMPPPSPGHVIKSMGRSPLPMAASLGLRRDSGSPHVGIGDRLAHTRSPLAYRFANRLGCSSTPVMTPLRSPRGGPPRDHAQRASVTDLADQGAYFGCTDIDPNDRSFQWSVLHRGLSNLVDGAFQAASRCTPSAPRWQLLHQRPRIPFARIP